MKIVKVSHPYSDATTYRQTPGGKECWGDYEFHTNDGILECDYWLVLNTLPEAQKVKCLSSHTLLWAGEPESIHKYNRDFVKQFSKVLTVQRGIDYKGAIYSQLGSPWFVEKSYDELKAITGIEKTKKMSIVVSNKQFTEGHKKRFVFAQRLKEHFGSKLDIFGRGVNDFDLKWKTLAPYEFSIAIENSSAEDYFTEKLSDCYLSFTYPIYYGCKNISSYFDHNSYSLIEIDDIDTSVRVIEDILEDKSFYSSRRVYLEKSRELVLEDYNFYSVIADIFDKMDPSVSIKVNKGLRPESDFKNDNSWLNKVRRKFN